MPIFRAMTIREIITAPDPRLKVISKPVAEVTAETRALMDDMLETMYAAPGIGLAAIQIGVPLRIIVMDLAKDDEEPDPRYYINPEILEAAEETAPYEEGCLSVPDVYDTVERPDYVKLRFIDYHGEIRTMEASGLTATCIQHEMDHLEGILFIDHLSRLKRSMVLKKLAKQKRLEAEA